MAPILLKEHENETKITRKFLDRVPFDKLDWIPHPRSMNMWNLAVHIAGLTSWVDTVMNSESLDLASTANKGTAVDTKEDLLQIFDSARLKGKEALSPAKENDFNGRWILRKGDRILADMTKYEAIRHSLNHTAHHRAQLGVYFRLLDIAVPGTYGPSADEQIS